MKDTKVLKIKEYYQNIVRNTREAFILAGIPKGLVFFEMFFPPDFEYMVPEDVVNFYKETRKAVILHLRKLGFTQREIARRLGGGSYHIVHQVLKDQEEKIDGTPIQDVLDESKN